MKRERVYACVRLYDRKIDSCTENWKIGLVWDRRLSFHRQCFHRHRHRPSLVSSTLFIHRHVDFTGSVFIDAHSVQWKQRRQRHCRWINNVDEISARKNIIGKIIVGGYKSSRKIKVNHALAGFAETLRLLGVYGLREQEEKPAQRPGRMPSDFRNDEVYRVSFRSELNDNDWTMHRWTILMLLYSSGHFSKIIMSWKSRTEKRIGQEKIVVCSVRIEFREYKKVWFLVLILCQKFSQKIKSFSEWNESKVSIKYSRIVARINNLCYVRIWGNSFFSIHCPIIYCKREKGLIEEFCAFFLEFTTEFHTPNFPWRE